MAVVVGGGAFYGGMKYAKQKFHKVVFHRQIFKICKILRQRNANRGFNSLARMPEGFGVWR